MDIQQTSAAGTRSTGLSRPDAGACGALRGLLGFDEAGRHHRQKTECASICRLAREILRLDLPCRITEFAPLANPVRCRNAGIEGRAYCEQVDPEHCAGYSG